MFGSPRTGSTWLLELLAHPVQLEARSPLGFDVPNGLGQPLDVLPINESLLPTHILTPAPGAPERRSGPQIRVMSDLFGDLAAYFFSQQFEDVWRPAIRDLALARFGAHLERTADSYAVADNAVMVIKEPNGSHAAPLIMSILDRARMIFLYRDGRDVVDSLLAMHGPGGLAAEWRGKPVETREQRLQLIREESLNWVARMTAAQRAFEERPAELRWRLRYEDLIAEPAGSLSALAGWLGVERDAAAIAAAVRAHGFGVAGQSSSGAAATRRAATPGLWRRNLDQSERALAHEIMGGKLEELGYDTTPELSDPP
jgi:hypothetical protein